MNIMQKKYLPKAHVIFFLLALSLQGCLGIGGSTSPQGNFKQNTGSGPSIGVNQDQQAIFQGKIFFTLNRNLYVLNGTRNVRQLTRGMDVRDPAVSPDGKFIAFAVYYKNYSDLMYMSISGGPTKLLRTGKGTYIPNPPYPTPRSTYLWFAQPSWIDNTHLLFLSDLQKADWDAATLGANSFLLDMQVFVLSINDPDTTRNQIAAYAAYGDGGDRDASYRPAHQNEIVYTHYAYDKSQTQQVIQIFLENPYTIVNHPEMRYHPGVFSFDPAVALTPDTPNLANLEPSFSPDGNFIAYVRRLDNGAMGLYIMPVPDGVTATPNDPNTKKKALLPYQQSSLILTQQFVSNPIWSPDGKRIAYITYANNAFDIWLANVSVTPKTNTYKMSGVPTQLTSTGSGNLDADSRPTWSA